MLISFHSVWKTGMGGTEWGGAKGMEVYINFVQKRMVSILLPAGFIWPG